MARLNVPEKVPFVTVSVVELLSGINGLQVVSVISVLYPKVAVTDVNVLGPLTVIVVPGPPDVGVLTSVEVVAVPEVTVKVLSLVSTRVSLPMVIVTQIAYGVVAFPDVGQLNGALVNPPPENDAELTYSRKQLLVQLD